MATVSGLLNDFCDSVNIPRPSSYVGSSRPSARQYLRLFKEIGDLIRNGPFDFEQLKRVYPITTVLNQSNYQAPGDFYKLLGQTQYDVTNQMPMNGPLSNAQLANFTYGITATPPYKQYQLSGPQNYTVATSPYTQTSAGYLVLSPAGANNTDQIVIAYDSWNYVWPRNWAPTTAYVQGDIRTGIAQIYICTVGGTSGTTRLTGTATITDGTCTWVPYYERYTISNDSDICLFDDDIMIAGIKWAWLRDKGQSYESERMDWENSVRSASARQNGATRANAGGISDLFQLNIQDGSWPV